MNIPTEPIGSIPRPLALIEAIHSLGDGMDPSLDPLYEDAIRDTIQQFEATGSRVITDGEQRKYHTTRETAFVKIRARVLGTTLAARVLGVE